MSGLSARIVAGVLAAVLAQAATGGHARADAGGASRVAPEDMSDQAMGVALGFAGGGRTTPGGLRVTGHYLYQLSDTDWFDGTAAFSFGSSAPACFRDRADDLICDHALADGVSAQVAATVRRFVGGRDEFWPFVRLGIGAGYVRFAGDDVGGLAIPLVAGGGMRVSVTPHVAVIVEGMVEVGVGLMSRGLGLEPQLGGGVAAGAEFRL